MKTSACDKENIVCLWRGDRRCHITSEKRLAMISKRRQPMTKSSSSICDKMNVLSLWQFKHRQPITKQTSPVYKKGRNMIHPVLTTSHYHCIHYSVYYVSWRSTEASLALPCAGQTKERNISGMETVLRRGLIMLSINMIVCVDILVKNTYHKHFQGCKIFIPDRNTERVM